MDLRKLLESNCGQSNPISQLIQQVTEDKALQDNYGNPSGSGLQQYNSMKPQSFRVDDLIKDLNQIETHAGPSIPAQNHCIPDVMWPTQHQRNSRAKYKPRWREGNFYSASFQNVFSPPRNELPMLAHIDPISQEYAETSVEPEGGVIISSLDELVEEESEEGCESLQEIRSEPLTEPNSNTDIIHPFEIPTFANYNEFHAYMCDYVDEKCVHGWVFTEPIDSFAIVQKNILNAKKYSHIENNPMNNISDVAIKGEEAIKNRSYSQAVLYFDEAVRRNPTSSMNWSNLSYSLYMNNEHAKAISSLKQFLSLYPGKTNAHRCLTIIYQEFHCNYQVCYWIFNWLKNNESYKHLIPTDFTMEDKNFTELDDGLLETVKHIFLKAARLNLSNIDSNLQLMIASLYKLSRDFDKELDCKLAAINASEDPTDLENEMLNAAYQLLKFEKPYEAIDTFSLIMDIDKHRSYEGLGYAYMYLQNYRQAIRYFKKALDAIDSLEESQFQIQENTLEAEFQLCLRLYLECYNKM